MSERDRQRLGGVEYEAVRFLSYVVPVYLVLWQLLGCLALGAYIHNRRPDPSGLNGLGSWWTGAFLAASAFNNSGMMLLDANMTAYNNDVYIMLTAGLLILAGNTMYPVFLRLFIWILRKCLPKSEDWADERLTLEFLLEHPRRCYTNLFPMKETWWLFLTVVILNGIDCAMFAILNVGSLTILPIH